MNKRLFLVITAVVLLIPCATFASEFSDYCQRLMETEGKCPDKICELKKQDDAGSSCVPKQCDKIPEGQCPLEFCDVLVNCRGEKICHFKMIDPPECGNLSYAGQDVPCCPGLVRRCGIAFLDNTCDMYGDNSEYNLPICIPCGDGICSNFENICNCPEDCGGIDGLQYKGQLFDEEAETEDEAEDQGVDEVIEDTTDL